MELVRSNGTAAEIPCGYGKGSQKFNTTVASTMSSPLAVASASLIISATLHSALHNPETFNFLHNILIPSRFTTTRDASPVTQSTTSSPSTALDSRISITPSNSTSRFPEGLSISSTQQFEPPQSTPRSLSNPLPSNPSRSCSDILKSSSVPISVVADQN